MNDLSGNFTLRVKRVSELVAERSLNQDGKNFFDDYENLDYKAIDTAYPLPVRQRIATDNGLDKTAAKDINSLYIELFDIQNGFKPAIGYDQVHNAAADVAETPVAETPSDATRTFLQAFIYGATGQYSSEDMLAIARDNGIETIPDMDAGYLVYQLMQKWDPAQQVTLKGDGQQAGADASQPEAPVAPAVSDSPAQPDADQARIDATMAEIKELADQAAADALAKAADAETLAVNDSCAQPDADQARIDATVAEIKELADQAAADAIAKAADAETLERFRRHYRLALTETMRNYSWLEDECLREYAKISNMDEETIKLGLQRQEEYAKSCGLVIKPLATAQEIADFKTLERKEDAKRRSMPEPGPAEDSAAELARKLEDLRRETDLSKRRQSGRPAARFGALSRGNEAMEDLAARLEAAREKEYNDSYAARKVATLDEINDRIADQADRQASFYERLSRDKVTIAGIAGPAAADTQGSRQPAVDPLRRMANEDREQGEQKAKKKGWLRSLFNTQVTSYAPHFTMTAKRSGQVNEKELTRKLIQFLLANPDVTVLHIYRGDKIDSTLASQANGILAKLRAGDERFKACVATADASKRLDTNLLPPHFSRTLHDWLAAKETRQWDKEVTKFGRRHGLQPAV